MNLQQLREDTRPEHEATEAGMPLMSPGLTLNKYRDVLRVLFPVLRSWEVWAAEYAPASVRPLLDARRRSNLLATDLRALGEADLAFDEGGAAPVNWTAVVTGNRTHLDQVLAAPEFEAAFLGAMYVLEGSTLGGRMIARYLEPVLGLEAGKGDAYFRGHGEATGALWRETTAAIAAVPEQYAELLTAAAKRTFGAFGAILGTLQANSRSGSVAG